MVYKDIGKINMDKNLNNYTDDDLKNELKSRSIYRKKINNTILYYTDYPNSLLCTKITKETKNKQGCDINSYFVLNGLWELKPTNNKNEYIIVVPEHLINENYTEDKLIIHWKKIKYNDVHKKLGMGLAQYLSNLNLLNQDENDDELIWH